MRGMHLHTPHTKRHDQPTVMGTFFSVVREQMPPKSKYTVDQMPDLSGKVVIVTGGNAGQYQTFSDPQSPLTILHVQASDSKQSRYVSMLPPLILI